MLRLARSLGRAPALAGLLACSRVPSAEPPATVAPPAIRESSPVPPDMSEWTGSETSAVAAAPGPASPDPRVGETRSVHPGINAPYRAADAVRIWSRRFERDGREVHDHQAQLVAALGLRPGMAVADVGAGTGLFTLAFAAAVGPGGAVYAVDLIPEFLAFIGERAAAAGLRQVQLVQASERSAGLAPASVDLIFMSDAYHHLEYPQHVLATLRAALRPGGSLWVIDFQREASTDRALRRHVRAGKAQVLVELAQAGFQLVEELPLLRENYVLHLRVGGQSPAGPVLRDSPLAPVPEDISPVPRDSPAARPPPPGFVDLRVALADACFTAGYAAADNFTGAPLPGYAAAGAWLLAAPTAALLRVQAGLARDGLSLQIFDAYRPRRASEAMVAWAARTGQARLVTDGYIARRSGHNHGHTIDLGLARRGSCEPLDMGSAWDTLDATSHTTRATGPALDHRLRLRQAMLAAGFRPYPREWWHFTFPVAGTRALDIPYDPPAPPAP